MSSASNSPRKRPGFLDSFRAAMTPPPLPEDTGGPIVRPRSVTIALALAALAAVVMLYVGLALIATASSGTDESVRIYNQDAAACVSQGIGTGTSVVVPTGGDQAAIDQATVCQNRGPLTDEYVAGVKRTAQVIGIVIAVVGAVAFAGAGLLFRGRLLGRKLLVGVTVLLVAGTLFLQIQIPLLLLATLFLVISVMLTFIGRGNLYFVMLRRRGAQR